MVVTIDMLTRIQRIVRPSVPQNSIYGQKLGGAGGERGNHQKQGRRNALSPDEMNELKEELADLLRYKFLSKYHGSEILQLNV